MQIQQVLAQVAEPGAEDQSNAGEQTVTNPQQCLASQVLMCLAIS